MKKKYKPLTFCAFAQLIERHLSNDFCPIYDDTLGENIHAMYAIARNHVAINSKQIAGLQRALNLYGLRVYILADYERWTLKIHIA